MLDLPSWNNIADFLNSNFTSALTGALVGAFAGAMAAQRVGDRAKQREAILQEIRSTNAAIMVAFTICNAGLALKRQFVKEIYETYIANRAALNQFKQRRALRQQPADLPFEFRADFRSLQVPVVPIDVLRTQLYEKISAAGRPLATVATLAGALASLEDVINKRNTLIERFRGLEESRIELLPALYFGVPYGEGHVSTEFADSIEALYSLTDDVIFFGHLLSEDLKAHGANILSQYKKIAKIKEEKIHDVDFQNAQALGLMPDAKNYAEWMRGFPNAVQPAVQGPTSPPSAGPRP